MQHHREQVTHEGVEQGIVWVHGLGEYPRVLIHCSALGQSSTLPWSQCGSCVACIAVRTVRARMRAEVLRGGLTAADVGNRQ